MPLIEAHGFVGGTEIRAGLPPLDTYLNSVYLPFDDKVFFDRDPNWGIYDKEGSLVSAAAYLRGDPPELIGQSWHADRSFQGIEEAPVGEYIYAGPLIPHYGHFLLTSLARLWPLVLGQRGRAKILFHAQGQPEEWFGTPYVRYLLQGLGLTPDDCIAFPYPVKIASLKVPGRSFGEQAFAHPVFAEMCHVIGRSMLKDHAISNADRRPIYFSKARLTSGVGRLQNEADLELALTQKADIEVVYPEELSLPSQVALFASGRLIVGTSSSAFHTSVFSEKNPRLLAIGYRNKIPSNYKMIDEINGNSSTYLWPSEGFEAVRNEERFLETFRVADPIGLATEIIKFIQPSVTGVIKTTSGCILKNSEIVSDHGGTNYQEVLSFLHQRLIPKSYLEIGTLKGETLALAKCRSIAIDPQFQVDSGVVLGTKPSCSFFQMRSDDFFAEQNPQTILGRPIDMAFLDGMHHCEFLLRDFLNTERYCKPNSVIVLHDCLPLEAPMAERDRNHTAITPHRNGWWTGDVWRTVRALKKYRPDLSISAFNAPPTGLVVVTNLQPASTVLIERYAEIVADMFSMMLDEVGISSYFKELNLESTAAIMTDEKLTGRYWL